MTYRGIVKKGFGEGKFWMKKAKDVFLKKYHIDVFLGTLNLELNQEYILSGKEKILPEEYGGNLVVLVEKCKIYGHEGYLVRTEKNNMPNRGSPKEYY